MISLTTLKDTIQSTECGKASYDVIGDHLDIYWPLDVPVYIGTVASTTYDVQCHISYEDGEEENFNREKEVWRFCTASSASVTKLMIHLPSFLASMKEYFVNKPFMRFQAHFFLSYAIADEYEEEELRFKKVVKVLPLDDVPRRCKDFSLRLIYKIKVQDYMTLKLKALIVPHGSEYSIRQEIRSNYAI